jgi:hypothetical protein
MVIPRHAIGGSGSIMANIKEEYQGCVRLLDGYINTRSDLAKSNQGIKGIY